MGYGSRGLDRREQVERVERCCVLWMRPTSPPAGRGTFLAAKRSVSLLRARWRLPRLLLLDEPFSALDGVASDALLARLQVWLREHRVQTVLVTHDATDAFAAGAEVALLLRRTRSSHWARRRWPSRRSGKEFWRGWQRTNRSAFSNPSSTGSSSSRTPNRAKTPARNLIRQRQNLRGSGSSAIDQRQSVSRRDSGRAARKPFANPACSISHAAGTFTCRNLGLKASSPQLQSESVGGSSPAIKATCFTCSALTTGFLKKLPALRQSGSPS